MLTMLTASAGRTDREKQQYFRISVKQLISLTAYRPDEIHFLQCISLAVIKVYVLSNRVFQITFRAIILSVQFLKFKGLKERFHDRIVVWIT
jgi:hypothetical protein